MLGRLYLAPYETTPTYRNVHNKFSVSYMLNLVLVDEEDRRYFKQQEIVLYRTAEDSQPQVRALGLHLARILEVPIDQLCCLIARLCSKAQPSG